MMTAKLLFASATPYQDPLPWRKAYSYSAFGHGALVLFMMLLTINQAPKIAAVLHEVNFIEKPLPVSKKPEAARSPVKGDSGVRSQITARKNKGSVKKRARSIKAATPRGKAEGKVVASKPLTGPIIKSNKIGRIGKSRGALIELAGRTGGTSPRQLLVPASATGESGELIALDTMGVEDLRRRESSLGTPLVSKSVVSGSLTGRARQLAQAAPGRRRKASAEYLKSNPLDKDKWGKSKGPFSMEGPLKYRKILKMELPPYPRWAEERGFEAAVSIRLWVNPKGRVIDNMYLEKTTGSSELDHLAMEALRRFLFVKLPSAQVQEDEWGVATFRFELRK